jgi:hypothetical protein
MIKLTGRVKTIGLVSITRLNGGWADINTPWNEVTVNWESWKADQPDSSNQNTGPNDFSFTTAANDSNDFAI